MSDVVAHCTTPWALLIRVRYGKVSGPCSSAPGPYLTFPQVREERVRCGGAGREREREREEG